MTQPLPTDPGLHELTLYPENWRLALSLPPGVHGRFPLPLVVALHYGGPMVPFKGGRMLRHFIVPAFRPLQAVIAAPDCNHGHWAGEQSEGEVLELVRRLHTAYGSDPSRTLLTGISRGGIGAWYIGGRNQQQFAAVLPLSAMPPDIVTSLPWTTPILVIHSRQDERFPLAEVEPVLARLRAEGADVTTRFIEGAHHHDVGRLIDPLAAAVPWILDVWAASLANSLRSPKPPGN
jgi:poly(3-hydroxybutyrate) depolymerase